MSVDQPQDGFIEKFFSRIPTDTAKTFTEQQLAAVKMAFGGRSWGAHAVDIRSSVPFLGRRFYFVLLMGRERRRPRRRYPIRLIATAVSIALLLTVFTLAVFGALAIGPWDYVAPVNLQPIYER